MPWGFGGAILRVVSAGPLVEKYFESRTSYDPPVPAMQDVIPLRLAEVTFPDSHPLAGQEGEVFGFLIRHPSGAVLVDTGFGTGHHQADVAYRPRRRSLDEALAEHATSRTDVVAVISTHLHLDHCGNNFLFPEVPIHVQAAEHDAAREERYTVHDWVWFPGADYRLAEGDAEVLPGITVLSTPGHTPGHQSVLVDTDGGPVLIAGQALYSAREYRLVRDSGELPSHDLPPDPESYLASAQRLIGLKKTRVFFSHDATEMGADELMGS